MAAVLGDSSTPFRCATSALDACMVSTPRQAPAVPGSDPVVDNTLLAGQPVSPGGGGLGRSVALRSVLGEPDAIVLIGRPELEVPPTRIGDFERVALTLPVWNAPLSITGRSGPGDAPEVADSRALGHSVVIARSLLVVGDPEDGQAGDGAGAVHAFDGVNVTTLRPGPGTGTRFGWSLATSGTELIVGAPGESPSGAVYVFDVRNGVDPLAVQRILGPDEPVAHRFGHSVSLAGDLLAVGAPGDRDDPAGSFVGSGSVHVLRRGAGGAFELERVVHDPRTTNLNPGFGHCVAITDLDGVRNLVVGRDSPFPTEALALLLRFESTSAPEEPVLETGLGANAGLGATVASTLAMGGDGHRIVALGLPFHSRVEIYRLGSGFSDPLHLKTLRSPVIPQPPGGDRYGDALSISGRLVAVGAPGPIGSGIPGAVYLSETGDPAAAAKSADKTQKVTDRSLHLTAHADIPFPLARREILSRGVHAPLRAEVTIGRTDDDGAPSLDGATLRLELTGDDLAAARLAGLDCLASEGGFSVSASTPLGPGTATVNTPQGVPAALAIEHDGSQVVLSARGGRSGPWTEVARAPLPGTSFGLAFDLVGLPAGATFTVDDLSLLDATPPVGATPRDRSFSALERALTAQADAVGRLERFDRIGGRSRLEDALGLLDQATAELLDQGLRGPARKVRAGRRATLKAIRLIDKGRPLDQANRRVARAAAKETRVLEALAP